MWVGNTERFVELLPGLNDCWISLEKAVKSNHPEISPSTLYALAAIFENVRK
jgi:myo-inositol-1-phosphate synthase